MTTNELSTSLDCAREQHEFCFWHGERRADVIRCGCICHNPVSGDAAARDDWRIKQDAARPKRSGDQR